MYSNLTLYYLKQLGITPWVHKETCLGLERQESESEQISPILIIIKKPHLSKKAEILLNKMLAYLGLNATDVLISESLQEYSFSKHKSPKVIWVLGVELSELFHSTQCQCPVLSGVSPEHLLDNPMEKKEAFKMLHFIKALVN
ncbi:DNA polymerase III subunit psi [Legionella bononiensis]|uniref:DNA polymerase III subunit psi n=1 Tax=Legionella bononiensis TaxID=2793102 RepID=A0ABS1W7L8_9GAMM|nr:DNA polymerase III subunit psi [Legionella bononiensis]MBL7480137.1 DNA polymerase III subunit psi [Legionella bononiensis]MBL7525348.1 DNA polymerase III subunit psi [Legionella bononiensis]MBL7561532.1 DNA polymerase III subunit psi [Legionella bononiensis]